MILKNGNGCPVCVLAAGFLLIVQGVTRTAESGMFAANEDRSGTNIRSLSIGLSQSAILSLRRDDRAYVRAEIRDGKQVYADVGIHLKGMSSFRPLKQNPCFTLKFDKFVPGQRYNGLKKFMLNNSVQDPTYLAEWLSYQIFRDAGLPAPRATHVFVELNGRKLGLYVLVEAVTSDFLKQHFKSGHGNLYEGYPLLDIDQQLDQDGGSATSQSDRKKLLQICRIENPAERWQRLPEVLDVDAYISYCVVEIFIGHKDGYAMMASNYRLYCDPITQRFTMIPHGLDLGFSNSHGPIRPPMTSIITRAVLGTPEGQARYRERASQIFKNVFSLANLSNHVEVATARLRAAARDPAEESRLQSCGAEMLRRVTARHAFIASEIGAGGLDEPEDVGTGRVRSRDRQLLPRLPR
jgi:hypothetical protein